MDTATLSCEWTNQRAGSQLNMHTYDDTRRSIFCVNRDCLIFEVHQIISWLLRDFFIFSSKKRTFLAKYRLFGEKEDLICVFFFKKVLFADQSPLKRTQLVSLLVHRVSNLQQLFEWRVPFLSELLNIKAGRLQTDLTKRMIIQLIYDVAVN